MRVGRPAGWSHEPHIQWYRESEVWYVCVEALGLPGNSDPPKSLPRLLVSFSHHSVLHASSLLAAHAGRFSPGRGSIFLDNVNCNGTELQFTDCRNHGVGVHNCGHYEDAGVVCIGKFTATAAVDFHIRLLALIYISYVQVSLCTVHCNYLWLCDCASGGGTGVGGEGGRGELSPLHYPG